MNLIVVDGQGGRIGKQIIERVLAEQLPCRITAIGTNTVATAAMLRAGAPQGATGENPLLVACRSADVIAGPIGIVIADSLLGEVTPAMAVAVGQCAAVKLLLPVSHCNNQVIGASGESTAALLDQLMEQLRALTTSEG